MQQQVKINCDILGTFKIIFLGIHLYFIATRYL